MANLIYIGNLDSMDPDESNSTNENPSAVQGSYSADEMMNVDVGMTDNFTSGYTYDDDYGYEPDYFNYDVGNGPVSSGLDAQGRFKAEIVTSDGATHYVTVSVYQTQSGDTFVRLPNGYEISKLTIGGMVGDGYDGITTGASSTSTVVCFCEGTRIATPGGARPVETLETGDLVLTVDHRAQPVLWRHTQTVMATPKTAPIRIAAGAFGDGLPLRTLSVSRQHRLYLRSPVAARMFGTEAILIPAFRLLGVEGVTLGPLWRAVTYHHIACARHEIVWAEGVSAETLHYGEEARDVLDLCDASQLRPAGPPARPLQEPRRLRRFAERLVKNGHIPTVGAQLAVEETCNSSVQIL